MLRDMKKDATNWMSLGIAAELVVTRIDPSEDGSQKALATLARHQREQFQICKHRHERAPDELENAQPYEPLLKIAERA